MNRFSGPPATTPVIPVSPTTCDASHMSRRGPASRGPLRGTFRSDCAPTPKRSSAASHAAKRSPRRPSNPSKRCLGGARLSAPRPCRPSCWPPPSRQSPLARRRTQRPKGSNPARSGLMSKTPRPIRFKRASQGGNRVRCANRSPFPAPSISTPQSPRSLLAGERSTPARRSTAWSRSGIRRGCRLATRTASLRLGRTSTLFRTGPRRMPLAPPCRQPKAWRRPPRSGPPIGRRTRCGWTFARSREKWRRYDANGRRRERATGTSRRCKIR